MIILLRTRVFSTITAHSSVLDACYKAGVWFLLHNMRSCQQLRILYLLMCDESCCSGTVETVHVQIQGYCWCANVTAVPTMLCLLPATVLGALVVSVLLMLWMLMDVYLSQTRARLEDKEDFLTSRGLLIDPTRYASVIHEAIEVKLIEKLILGQVFITKFHSVECTIKIVLIADWRALIADS